MKLISIYDEVNSPEILYNLLGERTPEQSISHKEMPDWEDHVEFIKSRPYKAWYLIKADHGYVGSIYLTKLREIGIFIFNEHQGRGWASEAIGLLKILYPGRFLANVNPDNLPSLKLFEKLGGDIIQVTFEVK